VAGIPDGTTLNLKGTYLKKGAFEEFYIEAITALAAGMMPAPATAQLADLQRNAISSKWWFQRVRTDLGAATLKMFDFSPAEFQIIGSGAACPSFGFGVVPSTSSDRVGAACNGTVQPPSAVASGATAPSDEILFGTDFNKGFLYSADCACAATSHDTLLTASSTLGGIVSGILVGDMEHVSATYPFYQYLAPKSSADAMFQ
jgi:hypothetical protein